MRRHPVAMLGHVEDGIDDGRFILGADLCDGIEVRRGDSVRINVPREPDEAQEKNSDGVKCDLSGMGHFFC